MKINIMQNTSIWLGDKLYNLGYFCLVLTTIRNNPDILLDHMGFLLV